MTSHQTSDYIYFKLGDVLELINNDIFDMPEVINGLGMAWQVSSIIDLSLHRHLCRTHGGKYKHRGIEIPPEYQYLIEL